MIKRRKFIVQAAAGAAGLALATKGFANIIVRKKKDRLGVALVGLGYYSTDLLAPGLQRTEHCYLAGIVTGTPSKAEKWKKQYNIPDKNIYNYGNYDTIADNPDIDVIYVVLPNSMHAEYTIRAANAGKHVWCEKPMALSVAECQSMIDACRKNKSTLCIGYRLHHEANTQRITGWAKEKPYGNVRTVAASAGYRENRTDHWKQKKAMGGGAMYDMGVYSLNAARYSTGMEPVTVSAQQSTTRPEIYTEVDESTVFDLEFPGGATAHCETSFGKGMNTLEVHFEKGWYKLSPFSAYSGIQGITSDGIQLNAPIRHEQAKQMDDDALAILNNTSNLLAPGEEGLADIRVVEAIQRSVREKRKVMIS